MGVLLPQPHHQLHGLQPVLPPSLSLHLPVYPAVSKGASHHFSRQLCLFVLSCLGRSFLGSDCVLLNVNQVTLHCPLRTKIKDVETDIQMTCFHCFVYLHSKFGSYLACVCICAILTSTSASIQSVYVSIHAVHLLYIQSLPPSKSM